MTVTIYTPAEGFTGVVAGVAFDRGKADVDELTTAQRAYFTQAGYGLGERPVRGVESPPAGHPLRQLVGTALRDAAQDGRRVTLLVDGAVAYEGVHDQDEVDDLVHESHRPAETVDVELPALPETVGEIADKLVELLGRVSEMGDDDQLEVMARLDAVYGVEPPIVIREGKPVDPPDDSQQAQAPAPAEKPNVRDPKDRWVTYAIDGCGADPDEAAAMTKEALVERFGKQEDS